MTIPYKKEDIFEMVTASLTPEGVELFKNALSEARNEAYDEGYNDGARIWKMVPLTTENTASFDDSTKIIIKISKNDYAIFDMKLIRKSHLIDKDYKFTIFEETL